MTEDEAAMTRCCGPEGCGGNSAGEPERYCLASHCMAWRTRHQWLDNGQANPDWVSYSPYAFEPGEGQERDDGFCGLAGQPS